MNKIIGIDFGEARIGLSISDNSRFMAFPLICIAAGKTQQETAKTLIAKVENEPYTEFVIGLPLLMNGKDSDMSKKVRSFAELLEQATGKRVHFWDERLTSKEVEKLMIEGNLKRKQRSKMLDTLSATLILQNYLDAQKFLT